MKWKKKGQKILSFLLITLILFVAIFTVTGVIKHIKEQNSKIELYAKRIQNQQTRIEQLKSHNKNLEQIVLQQHEKLNKIEEVNTYDKETTETFNSDYNELMDSASITTMAIGTLATFGQFIKTRLIPIFP